LPGLINTHWHLLAGSAADSEEAVDEHIETAVVPMLGSLLDRGITTIMSPGDHFPHILDIRDSLAAGEMKGPRLLAVGPVFTAPNGWPTQICQGRASCVPMVTAEVTTSEQARAKVRALAEAGVDAVKLVYDDLIAPGARLDYPLIEEIADEARQHGLTLHAHVSTGQETGMDVVAAGAGALVHPIPLQSQESASGARILREQGIAVSTTISGSTPELREAAARLGMLQPGQQETLSESDEFLFSLMFGYVEHLHNEGVTLAFGTDSVIMQIADAETNEALATAQFWAEVHTLNQIMTNEELLASLTRNAAIYLEMDDEIGTLAPGMLADIVIVDGNPLENIDDLANVSMVIQSGVVVADHR
ncbi:MAG: amidohydrolase family protein, partial [Rubricoccaceae bacterium]|nr:amidohydrolase family protein [Rubricoccaceae bacterium]